MSFDEKNSHVSAALSTRLDQLNSAIDVMEAQFRKMGIVVECEVDYGRWPDDPAQPSYYTHAQIGMVKLQGQWRLCHGYMQEDRPDEVEWKPLRDASVQERIAAIRHVEKLREEIVRSKERLISRLDGVIAAAVSEIERYDDENNADPGSSESPRRR